MCFQTLFLLNKFGEVHFVNYLLLLNLDCIFGHVGFGIERSIDCDYWECSFIYLFHKIKVLKKNLSGMLVIVFVAVESFI